MGCNLNVDMFGEHRLIATAVADWDIKVTKKQDFKFFSSEISWDEEKLFV